MGTLISMLFPLVWIIAWICITISIIIAKRAKWKRLEKVCTKHVEARVVDVIVHRGRRGSIGYKPIFKVVEPWGEIIIDTAYFMKYEFAVGTIVGLLVNPNNYREFIYRDNKYNIGKRDYIILFIITLVPIVYILMMIWGNN